MHAERKFPFITQLFQYLLALGAAKTLVLPLAHFEYRSATLTHDILKDAEHCPTQHVTVAIEFHDSEHLVEDVFLYQRLINVTLEARENGGRLLEELDKLQEVVAERRTCALVLGLHDLVILLLNLLTCDVGDHDLYELEQSALRHLLKHVLILATSQ